MTSFFVLIIAVVTALTCALIGNFLVLRRLAMLGDAMSHAVLPGILVGYLIARDLQSPLFFLGAVMFCVIMAVAIEALIKNRFIREESAIGIAFTSLFALGVVLLVRFADTVHLDQDAVLYGQVEFSAFERLMIGGFDFGPRLLWIMGSLLLLNSAAVVIFYKEWKITTFDPGLAVSVGVSPRIMHYFLVVLTALTVVAAFEAVGSVLAVALLIVPAATASLLGRSLAGMILWSLFFAAL